MFRRAKVSAITNEPISTTVAMSVPDCPRCDGSGRFQFVDLIRQSIMFSCVECSHRWSMARSLVEMRSKKNIEEEMPNTMTVPTMAGVQVPYWVGEQLIATAQRRREDNRAQELMLARQAALAAERANASVMAQQDEPFVRTLRPSWLAS